MKITITTKEDKIEKVALSAVLNHSFPSENDTNWDLSTGSKFEIKWIGQPIAKAQEWVELYAKGVQPNFLPPLLEPDPIHQALSEIPFAQTISYKEFARRVGYEGAQRAIGTMIGKNRFALFLPCHRVIRSDGSLGGFAFGPEIKSQLIEHEKLTKN